MVGKVEFTFYYDIDGIKSADDLDSIYFYRRICLNDRVTLLCVNCKSISRPKRCIILFIQPLYHILIKSNIDNLITWMTMQIPAILTLQTLHDKALIKYY